MLLAAVTLCFLNTIIVGFLIPNTVSGAQCLTTNSRKEGRKLGKKEYSLETFTFWLCIITLQSIPLFIIYHSFTCVIGEREAESL